MADATAPASRHDARPVRQATRLVLRLLRSEGWRSIARRARFHARRRLDLRSRARLGFGELAPARPGAVAPAPPTDIVVPVYGALEQASACLSAVLEHTDLRRHRLLVVDDGNDQAAVSAFLDDFVAGAARRGLAVELLRSSANSGFTAAANLGMRASDRDVVLLNSDAQVAAGWLDGLRSVAGQPETASVTPLSNRATICTVPFAAQGPPRPDAAAIQAHADLVERCSFHESPVIPTPVGFCVLLTRRALAEVGLFDEEGFPRGYGEENDWGWRASRHGLRHLAADAVFVYHEGARSFSSSERRRRMSAAARVLESRYPEHRTAVAAHLALDPLRLQRSVIQALDQDSGTARPGVLHLTGSDPAYPRGGVDHHVAELRLGLESHGWSAIVAWIEGSELRVLWGSSPAKEWSFTISDARPVERIGRLAEVLGYLIRALDVRVVHAHDTTGFERSSLLGLDASLVLTLHDFQLFCRRPHLIDSGSGAFCDYSTDEERCARCLAGGEASARTAAGSRAATTQESWRRESARLLDRADALVAPSRFMAEKVSELFAIRDAAARLHVIEHGRPQQTVGSSRTRPPSALRVVFLGQFHPVKGSHVYGAIVRELAADPRFRFAVVGGIVDHEALDEMRRSARVETAGWYERSTVSDLLHRGSDVVAFTSIAPESSSYTLTEAHSAGLPVIAFDQGAVAERLRRMGAADFLVPPAEGAAGFARRLRGIAEGALSWPVDGAEPAWSSAKMAERYAALYRSLETRSERRPGRRDSSTAS